MRSLYFVLIAILSLSQSAFAQLFKINKNPATTVSDALIKQLEDEVNKRFPDVDGSKYLKGMANAAIISNRALGVDYASDMKLFAIGVGGAVGAQTASGSMSDLNDKEELKKIEGVGVSAGATIGMNMGLLGGSLGPIDFDRLNIYLSALRLNRKTKDVEIKLSSFGLYGQYVFYKPVPLPSKYLFQWTGLNLGAGLSVSNMQAGREYDDINKSATEGAITLNYTGVAKLGAKTSSTTITGEVSTGIQILYALGLYTGLGIDLNSGQSKADINTVGNITASGAGAPAGDIGEGVLDAGQKGKAAALHARMFLGTQFNISLLKIFVQATKSVAPSDLIAVSAGTRIVW